MSLSGATAARDGQRSVPLKVHNAEGHLESATLCPKFISHAAEVMRSVAHSMSWVGGYTLYGSHWYYKPMVVGLGWYLCGQRVYVPDIHTAP